MQSITKTISDHVNLGSYFFEVDYVNKIPEIKRNGDCFIKLFYDKEQVYLKYLKQEENIEKKIIDGIKIFKGSRYQNAFVSSEFLLTISIDAWHNIIYLFKQNNIQITKLILVLRNPQKRFFSSLFNRVRERKYNHQGLSEAFRTFIKNEFDLYKKVKKLKRLFGNKLSIIDYDSNKEILLDKIFDEANLKKGFPYNTIQSKQENKNKFSNDHCALIGAILDNSLINFLHGLMRKFKLEGCLLYSTKNRYLINLLDDLPVHQNKKISLQFDCESSKLFKKVNKEYSKYTQQNIMEDDITQLSIATLKFKYFYKYLLIYTIIKSNSQK